MAATQKNPAELEKARALAHVPWCEEYEKMISGMLYAASAPDLTAARYRARAFAHAYNTYFPPATQDPSTGFDVLAATRQEMLQGIIGRLGEHVFIEPPFNIDYGCNITLGARFYANFNLTILDCSLVTIGARCMFGPNVSIFAATHETGVASRRADVEYGRPVVVGDDCWVGGGAVILPGVTIGRGCTVGAGSVVTRDVEDFCVVMGQPARVVKRVEEVPVEFLEESG
ncbi:galactoside O-acetyltransferase [Boeremia exigua]|uniref:galactoside O-acetyltransferase n=1 Tax=Boeremia exigua TaxID=749465 RepID=UPI001E8D859B|nr:galactoside O-acetyltransferase [Boeremia exigua]KAH6620416.1 galactoside O-acetyltransferase [Boeremia exigua]